MTIQWWVYTNGNLIGAFDDEQDAYYFANEYANSMHVHTTVVEVEVVT